MLKYEGKGAWEEKGIAKGNDDFCPHVVQIFQLSIGIILSLSVEDGSITLIKDDIFLEVMNKTLCISLECVWSARVGGDENRCVFKMLAIS